MHRIRLREPWTASLQAESSSIVYARKFHKPTGVDQQSIALRVTLLPKDSDRPDTVLAVLINGRELPAQSPSIEPHCENALHFELRELESFNSLELRISCATGKTGPKLPQFDATVIPTFGSFVIESAELQIE